ncbi:protein-methionine-sulfoxide reductase heme-binding subunit MsrQ [Vibrio algicola]|uniref:Protein-methionine-sulfoxide reductase heme-binding subunit MsrQ n=1 Tax=Vibrio algicola TaxID=2662262 RepID=A0A5Q0TMZ9_9VIBR|nr:protein-methionine-sulfoxide reductase heme-binding subunit MsrQ [Vibrio algicola]
MTLLPKHTIWLKVLIHTGHIFAFLWLYFAVVNGYLGADPVEPIIHFTGKTAINSLLLTLLITPVTQKFKLGALIRVRRLLGVYCFVWALLHLSSFAWFDLALEWQLIGSEIIKRPYLVVGASVWIILFLLTLTSTQSMQRKLGKKWQQLHNWVYLAAILAPIHYYWSVKSGIVEPVIYLMISLLLLYLRQQKIRRWLKVKTH